MKILVKNIAHLKRLSKNGGEFSIALRYGLRSSKHIRYEDGKFYILHYIDGTEEHVTPLELKRSFIGEAIEKKTFIKI